MLHAVLRSCLVIIKYLEGRGKLISGKEGAAVPDFILRDNLLDSQNGLLPNDKLTINVEVRVYYTLLNVSVDQK